MRCKRVEAEKRLCELFLAGVFVNRAAAKFLHKTFAAALFTSIGCLAFCRAIAGFSGIGFVVEGVMLGFPGFVLSGLHPFFG